MAYVIGLDIGGTKIEGILAAATSTSDPSLPKVIKKIRVPTDAAGGRSKVLNNIVVAITSLCGYGKENIPGFKLKGIGIGTAGFLKKGKLEMVPNIPCLKGVRLRDILSRQLWQRKIVAPLYIENDSICFALAEFMFGTAKGHRNVVGVIVGTGIGGGLILDGEVYRGRDGGAGHIGHTTIDPRGPKCGCGQRGHFESWCSGKHITQRYIAAGGKIPNPDPRKIFHSKEALARKIMSETYDKFGIAFANIINTFNPEVIVLGGGVSNLPEEFYRRVMTATRKYAYPALSANVKIVKNKLGDSAGVFGAAALALKN
ncbi:ROK family protein [Candidatus Woesearchaeota archaeon]|nr:ROK family protein [Candidatus Woesearchaeota archaeon]